MIKNIKFLIALLAILQLSSCSKFLEFEPENVALEEDALQTADDLQGLLNSTYDVARSGKFLGGQAFMLADLMADNMDGSQLTGDFSAYYNRTTGRFISATRDIWQEGYFTIGRSNILLQSLDVVSDLSAADRTRIQAEAKFLRALAHFVLVRYFGQPYGYTQDNSHWGIPIRTDYEIKVNSRNTVAEVYTQIVQDLTEAIPDLPMDNGNYATSWSAKGLLAIVYFQMNDFQNAYDQANDVISGGPFALMPMPNGRYQLGGSSENVFQLVSTGTADNSSGTLAGYYRTDFANEPAARMTRAFHDIVTADTADSRGAWFELVDDGQLTERVFMNRFNGIDYFNVPVVHLTELTLIRGEAAAAIGNTTQAKADLDSIRVRAGLQPQAATDAATIILDLQSQRRIELIGEGTRLWDLKRQATNGNSGLTIRGSSWDCPGLVVQFPDDEIKGNPDLILNPEGGCQ